MILLVTADVDDVHQEQGPVSMLEDQVYTFGTIQIEPLYSQYGDGFIRNLTDRLARKMDIRHKIVSYSATNGAWDNLVHTVANGEIDVGASLLTKTRCREEEVSFTLPFLTSSLSALYHGNRGHIRRPTEVLSSGFKLGTLNSSSVMDIMADSSHTYVQEILSEILSKNENLVHTVQEGIARARHENFVFIVDTVLADYYAAQKPCELRTLPLSSDLFNYGFIVRRGSPLLSPMSAAILEMEHDLSLPELVKKMIFKRKVCTEGKR